MFNIIIYFVFPYFMKVNEFSVSSNGKIEISKDQRSNPVLVKATYVNYITPVGNIQKQKINDFNKLPGIGKGTIDRIKEIIKTGKRGSRIGKFISGKIYDDFENIVICLEGYYPQLAGI